MIVSGYSKLFLPKALNIVVLIGRSSGLLISCGLPNRVQSVQWHKVAKNHLSLQLRVQLRNLTGFPLDTCLKVPPIRGKYTLKMNEGSNVVKKYFLNVKVLELIQHPASQKTVSRAVLKV
jgi:hypothetical protein